MSPVISCMIMCRSRASTRPSPSTSYTWKRKRSRSSAEARCESGASSRQNSLKLQFSKTRLTRVLRLVSASSGSLSRSSAVRKPFCVRSSLRKRAYRLTISACVTVWGGGGGGRCEPAPSACGSCALQYCVCSRAQHARRSQRGSDLCETRVHTRRRKIARVAPNASRGQLADPAGAPSRAGRTLVVAGELHFLDVVLRQVAHGGAHRRGAVLRGAQPQRRSLFRAKGCAPPFSGCRLRRWLPSHRYPLPSYACMCPGQQPAQAARPAPDSQRAQRTLLCPALALLCSTRGRPLAPSRAPCAPRRAAAAAARGAAARGRAAQPTAGQGGTEKKPRSFPPPLASSARRAPSKQFSRRARWLLSEPFGALHAAALRARPPRPPRTSMSHALAARLGASATTGRRAAAARRSALRMKRAGASPPPRLRAAAAAHKRLRGRTSLQLRRSAGRAARAGCCAPRGWQ